MSTLGVPLPGAEAGAAGHRPLGHGAATPGLRRHADAGEGPRTEGAFFALQAVLGFRVRNGIHAVSRGACSSVQSVLVHAPRRFGHTIRRRQQDCSTSRE